MTRLTAHQLPTARLRDALRAGGLDDLPDADLLDRFARYGEHAAFEALLRRHGAMVFGVCRRILVNAADVDDAFQATFLVFVRKARAVRRGDRLGPWLYGVAVRVAMKARGRAARLAARRTEATDMIPDPTEPVEVPDWLPILDAELSALPAKYREPLLLCELQGASRADAAKALGIPEGTLSSRLARGRELLRKRLLKHGTLLPAGGLATLFTASGVGRATVPATLLAKTSEVAAVSATGAASVGMVPAGAARLTDEVLKGMFLMKLRMAGGAILATGLLAVGLMAAWPGEAPGQPEKPKATATAVDAKPQPAVPAANGPKLADRDAFKGLWILDKFDLGKGIPADEQQQARVSLGKMQFLVTGDVWWAMMMGQPNSVAPILVKIDSQKNPKWIDIAEPDGGGTTRCIYELDGDKLRVCMAPGASDSRPAEFNTEDDTQLIVMNFRREKLPAAAGDKALIGSWEMPFERMGVDFERKDVEKGKMIHTPIQRVEILDGFLFAYSTDKGRGNSWVGGKYTVDTTKNPKWIDVDLVCPTGDKVTKFYGCYEVADGRLKLALGTKRATRPLELKPATDVLFFDVKATKEPLAVFEKITRDAVPAPRTKDRGAPKSANLPALPLPDKSPTPKPKVGDTPAPNSLPKLPDPPDVAPVPRQVIDSTDEKAQELIRLGQFAEAEKYLRGVMPDRSRSAEDRLLLGICVLERTKGRGPVEAEKVRKEAVKLFKDAIEIAKTDVTGSKRAKWVQSQAELRTLLVVQMFGTPDELLEAANPLLAKYRGTVEGLIVYSFTYHAFKKRGSDDDARRVKEWMREAFEKLAEKPDAFTATSGEYSREYWEKQWFAE